MRQSWACATGIAELLPAKGERERRRDPSKDGGARFFTAKSIETPLGRSQATIVQPKRKAQSFPWSILSMRQQ